MYQAALHLPWSCSIPTTVHSDMTRSNAPIFITNCAVLPIDHLAQQRLCQIPTTNRPNIYTQAVDVAKLNLRIDAGGGQNYKKNYRHSPVQFPNNTITSDLIHSNIITCKVEGTNISNEHSRPLYGVPNVSIQNCDGFSSGESGRGLKRQHERVSNNSPSHSPTSSPICHSKRRYRSNEDLHQKTEKINNAVVVSSNEKVSTKPMPVDNPNLFEPLSNIIWQFVIANKQTEEMFAKKIKLRDVLYNDILRKLYPCCGLYIVGSSLTGLGWNNSDLDLCVMLSQAEINQETEAIDILRMILRNISECRFFSRIQLIHAKVPILKFFDCVSGVDVDLNVNNSCGIRNTQLLNCYNRLDWRFSALAVMVKLWARQNNINDARTMTLTSYSLVLMVIHFLQASSPPVLPCLQKLLPDKFDPQSDVRQLILREELPPFKSENTKNLGELLLGFFNYYGNEFNFSRNVISIRTGGILPKDVAMSCKSPKNKRGQWKFICIEEPMDRTNTSHSVYNEKAFNRIISVFQNSYKRLLQSKKLQSVVKTNELFS